MPLFAVTLIGLVDFTFDGIGRSLLRANATKHVNNPLGAQSDALLPQGALAFEGNKKGNLCESTVEFFPQVLYFRQKIQLSWLTFCRFTVLCASSSGRLQLLDLQHQEHPNMSSLPLLPPARPVHLTVHPSKAVLVVACQGSDKLWELRCMSPVTGALSSSLVIIISHHHHHHHHAQACCTGRASISMLAIVARYSGLGLAHHRLLPQEAPIMIAERCRQFLPFFLLVSCLTSNLHKAMTKGFTSEDYMSSASCLPCQIKHHWYMLLMHCSEPGNRPGHPLIQYY